MYKQLSFEDVIECSLFTKQHVLSQNKAYLFPYFIRESLFEVREMRNLLFNNAVVIYGEYNENELTDVVFITLVKNNKYAFCILDLCPLQNKELVEYALMSVFADITEVRKCKFTTSRRVLKAGGKDLLESLKFKQELCFRKFRNPENDVFVFGLLHQ